tara:strand:+ start:132 stop:1100 length:969 start_codon:yes stop_codon:yes gene_type:complete
MLKLNTLSGFGSGAAAGCPEGVTTNGYYIGGLSYLDSVDTLVFATSTAAANTDATLPTALAYFTHMSQKFVAAYTCGGYTAGGYAGAWKNTQKMVYATSACSAVTDGDLNVSHGLADTGDASEGCSKGYTISGRETDADSWGDRVTTTHKLTFATETNTLVTDANYHAATSGSHGVNAPLNSYCSGGDVTGAPETDGISKLNFATDTAAEIAATRTAGKEGLSGFSSATAGYWTDYTPTQDKITFATDTVATVTDTTANSVTHYSGMGTSDGVTYGYWTSGSGAASTVCDRLTISTEVSAAHTDADSSVQRDGGEGISDGNT